MSMTPNAASHRKHCKSFLKFNISHFNKRSDAHFFSANQTSALRWPHVSSHPAKREYDVGESEARRAMCVKAAIVFRV